MFRLVYLTFHGEERFAMANGHDAHGHAPAHGARSRAGIRHAARGGHRRTRRRTCTMRLRRWRSRSIVLAIGSVVAGYIGVPHALGGTTARHLARAGVRRPTNCGAPVTTGELAPRFALGELRAGHRAGAGVADARRAEPAQPGARSRPRPRTKRPRASTTRTALELTLMGVSSLIAFTRHRPGDLAVAEEPPHPRTDGAAVPGPAPAAAEQVLRRRSSTTPPSCSRSRSSPGRAVARDGRR